MTQFEIDEIKDIADALERPGFWRIDPVTAARELRKIAANVEARNKAEENDQ